MRRNVFIYPLLILLLVACANIEGESQPSASAVHAENISSDQSIVGQNIDVFLKVIDDLDREVTITHQPKRILTLTPTFLDMIYALGGETVGRPDIPDDFTLNNLPEEAKALPSVGAIGNPNLETMISLQPDLVIGTPRAHDRFIDSFQSAGIPMLILKMHSYEDVKMNIQLIGTLTGNELSAKEALLNMEVAIQEIQAKLPNTSPKVAIIHLNSEEVLLETKHSLAGHIAQILKINQLSGDDKSLEDRTDKTYFSLEKLVEMDPDLILFTIRGNKKDVEQKLQTDIESNPAWKTLRAVKEGQVIFLPPEYFMSNAGVKYADAVEYMAKIVYPEVFGHVK